MKYAGRWIWVICTNFVNNDQNYCMTCGQHASDHYVESA
jgi:hypothetical protein